MDLFKYIETLQAAFLREASVPKQRENAIHINRSPQAQEMV